MSENDIWEEIAQLQKETGQPDGPQPVEPDKKEPTCEICGRPLELRTYRGGRRHRFCSDRCRKKAERRSHGSGKNH